MAAASSSPAQSSNSNDTATTSSSFAAGQTTAASASASAPAPAHAHAHAHAHAPAPAPSPNTVNGAAAAPPPKNLRGLNKPKCSKCGNVARSRCPYQSCKSCCAKAQNPCHIHVLKPNATFPDKAPSSNSTLSAQQSSDVSTSGASLRVSTLRQLSQFQGTQLPVRTKRTLTRKDAAAINRWRFSKLKEDNDNNIEVENEAFDRYIQNVSWLEEAFSVNSILGGFTSDVPPEMGPSSIPIDDEENTRRMFLSLKARLRSDPKRVDACRKRMRDIVEQGLLKLHKCEFKQDEVVTDADDLSKEMKKQKKKKKSWRMKKLTEVSDLMDKLNKARTEEDLQSCVQMKSKLFERYEQNSHTESACLETSEEQTAREDAMPRQDKCHVQPALYATSEISQPTLDAIEDHFSSSTQIEDL